MKKKLLLAIALGAVASCAAAFGVGCSNPNSADNAPKHNYGEWVIDREASCTRIGQKYHVCQDEDCNSLEWEAIPMIAHDYRVENITASEHTLKCSVCGDTKTEAHTFNSENTCSICEYERDTTLGLIYTLNEDRSSYSVTGIDITVGVNFEISIPSTYLGFPVTRIERFMDEGYYIIIKSIKLSKNIVSVGNSMDELNYLQEIIVDEDNQTYKSIDGNLYSQDGKSLIRYAGFNEKTHFDVPDAVVSIFPYAFAFSANLNSLTIPDSVTSIGDKAFGWCDSLESVTIPDSVTSIGDKAFGWCDSLESVTIPDSVTSIGDKAFWYCNGLTIYCEAEEQPSGWANDWNYSNCPVVWGYKGN